MKRARYTDEDIVHFIHAFAAAFGGVPAFAVYATQTKNTFYFRILVDDCDALQVIQRRSTPFERDVGGIASMSDMFNSRNPKIFLRTQIIKLDELVSAFNMNMQAVCAEVFKHIEYAIKDDVMCFGKFTSKAQIDWDWSSDGVVDHTHALLHVLPNISSIDELMVWADLQVS